MLSTVVLSNENRLFALCERKPPPLQAGEDVTDPYLFDFLGTDMPRREVELEQKLTEHIQSFLLELGQGFAFVGGQVHLEVRGQDFYLSVKYVSEYSE